MCRLLSHVDANEVRIYERRINVNEYKYRSRCVGEAHTCPVDGENSLVRGDRVEYRGTVRAGTSERTFAV